jgi:pimeloyl-ACP methyl ester carboxylesterase
MPEETWPLVAAHWKQPRCFEGMARHFECLAQSVEEMSRTAPLDAPTMMLSGRLNEHPTSPEEYAKRISGQTCLVYAEQSGHWIQLDEPGLVVGAIRELLQRATIKGVVGGETHQVASTDSSE